MKYSIVLPVYNVSNYIERCLTSCVRQTYEDIEIIVVDDCGQDDSIQKVETFAKKDSRIKIVRNARNMGTYHARRMGVEYASGDYVLFLDPDDELEGYAVAHLAAKLEAKVDLVLYCSRSVPKLKFWQLKSQVPSFSAPDNIDIVFSEILKCNAFRYGTEGKLIKRSVLVEAYCDLNVKDSERLVYGEDKLLFFYVLGRVNSIASTNARLYIYHRNPSSVTIAESSETLSSKVEQLDKVVCLTQKLNLGDSEICRQAKMNFIIDLKSDQLRLGMKAKNSYIDKVLVHYKVAKLTGKSRDYVKLLFLMATCGFYGT